MPLSKVNKIELNKKDGTLNLKVGVVGFDADAPIEISGEVTQTSGTVATYYAIRTMPKVPPNTDGTPGEAVVTVESVSAVPPNKFDPGQPITVVSRAAEVWITTLDAGAAQPENPAVQAEWAAASFSYAVCEPGHTPPTW